MAVVPVVAHGSDDAPVRADCSTRSEADFPGAYKRAENLVVGPLAMIGAGGDTSAATVERFGGNKFPVLVRAGHTVTISVPNTIRATASLGYGPLPQGQVSARDGHGTVTFVACRQDQPSQSRADGPVTFWSGFVFATQPSCVPLDVYVDAAKTAQRVGLSLGRHCTKSEIHGPPR
jgi:hypothetical protein